MLSFLMNLSTYLRFLQNQNHTPVRETHNSEIEVFQCLECSRTHQSYNAKLKKSWMIQHLNSTMHRNKSTLICCLRCKQEILCNHQNAVSDHSCPLSNLLYQSIHPETSPRTGMNIASNHSNLNRYTENIVNECEVIGDVTNSGIQQID